MNEISKIEIIRELDSILHSVDYHMIIQDEYVCDEEIEKTLNYFSEIGDYEKCAEIIKHKNENVNKMKNNLEMNN